MKITPLLSLILIILGSIWSCTFNNVDDPKVVVSIEDEFEIQLWETLSSDQRSLQLRTETLAEEQCLNYEIAFQVVKRSNRIRTTIDDIIEPDDCLPGNARPTAHIDLGKVDNGLYEFEINLKNSTIVNTGQLVVNDNSYLVEMNSTDGITLTPNQLLRIPEGTVWGYLSADNVENIATDFLTDLNTSENTKEFLEGNYGYFSLTGDNEISFPIETTFQQKRTFVLDYQGEVEELETLVEQYKVQYGELLKLQVYTWQGQIF
ncbi:MAG: hypothetical protein AB8G22_17365 [Saprospiraceae bacterium]